jgi:hypothetical protein
MRRNVLQLINISILTCLATHSTLEPVSAFFTIVSARLNRRTGLGNLAQGGFSHCVRGGSV